MKIAYTNKRLLINLFLGLMWFGIGISYFLDNERGKWYPYFVIALGTVYISLFLFEYFKEYVEITNDTIKINSLPTKEIQIREINAVTYFADDYIFKTPDKILKIRRSQISKNQLPEFELFFNKLKNPLI